MSQNYFNFFLLLIIFCFTGINTSCKTEETDVIVGAEQVESYYPIIKDKKIGLVVNNTSLIGEMHLVDFLLSKKINIKAIFAPEHGFRGNNEAGEDIKNALDPKTGIPIISLYGEKKKPSDYDLKGIDAIIFDIQDVGCRFFTYISTLHYVMEACASNNILLIILDRPNPNGDYIDGPVLNKELKSFIGTDPLPIVHGCTIGELALMINSEGWLNNNLRCRLEIITCKNYNHSIIYSPPVKPSPNLPNITAIRLYPSLCLFESTNVSIGRGTLFPFQTIGYPDSSFGNFTFTPASIIGVSNNPLHNEKLCYGDDLRNTETNKKFTLSYFICYFNKFSEKNLFWNSRRWIDLLTGDPNFYNQINLGLNEEEIRKSWQPDLEKYKATRSKYLLYPDFK